MVAFVLGNRCYRKKNNYKKLRGKNTVMRKNKDDYINGQIPKFMNKRVQYF